MEYNIYHYPISANKNSRPQTYPMLSPPHTQFIYMHNYWLARILNSCSAIIYFFTLLQSNRTVYKSSAKTPASSDYF